MSRGGDDGGSGTGDRVLTSLLTEMDGVEELNGVLVLAATNRPDVLVRAICITKEAAVPLTSMGPVRFAGLGTTATRKARSDPLRRSPGSAVSDRDLQDQLFKDGRRERCRRRGTRQPRASLFPVSLCNEVLTSFPWASRLTAAPALRSSRSVKTRR